jgi:hypothetical protein
MTAYLARIELRRGWRGMLAVALLIAIVVGVVIASIAGARRSRTAFDRYLEAIRSIDIAAFGDPAGLDALEGLPMVEEAVPMDLPAIMPRGGGPNDFFPMVVAADDRVPYELMRYPLLEGRRPGRDAPLEVALGQRTADRLGVGVGDVVPVDGFSQEAFDDGGEPDRPAMELDVVGIVRDPGDIGARRTDITITFLSPAFRDAHDPGEIGSLGPPGSLITLASGYDVEDLSAAVGDLGVELEPTVSKRAMQDQTNPTMRSIATALLVFALIAGVAGAAAVMQSVARLQAVAASDDRALAAVGITRGSRWARLAVPGLVSGVIGCAGGLAIALGASRWFPVGLARRAEVDRGLHADGTVFAIGGLLSLLAVGVIVGVAAALRVLRPISIAPRARLTMWGRAVSGASAPAPIITGLSFATGTAGQPARAGIGGTLLGVLGVVAALVFAASVSRLEDTPELYGWGWDAVIEGADLADLGDTPIDAEAILGDDDLAAAGNVLTQLGVTLDGTPQFATSVTDVKSHLPPVMVRGREPVASGEIAVGGDTLKQIGAQIGDEVELSVGERSTPVEITGVVALPVPEDGGSSAAGVLVAEPTARALDFPARCEEGDSCSRSVGVVMRDGVDPEVIAERYADPELGTDVQLPIPPGEIDRLAAVQDLPRFLAVFLAVLAAAAISFATATTVARRRADLAVLRAIGMTRRQVRLVVTTLVVSLTLIGALLGTGAGIVVGRLVWRAVVGSVSLPFSPAMPVAMMLLVPLAAIAMGEVVASASRTRAGRIPAAIALRAE